MSCRVVKRVLPEIELARTDAGGTAGAQTVVLYVRPVCPKLFTAVRLFFRPTTPAGTVPASGNTVSIASAVNDKTGVIALQTLVSGAAVPYGYEGVTDADLLVFTCSLSKVGSEAGQWIAVVSAAPVAGVCDAEFQELAAGLSANLATPARKLA